VDKHQKPIEQQYSETREFDKLKPKFTIEVYKIEKNYKPVLVKTLQSFDHEMTTYLPENRHLFDAEGRFTYKVVDNATKKVVEDNIEEAIESIRFNKHLGKNHPTMDLGAMQRMELDNDDPNFLSWEEYAANDDEYEEGDDEYIPRC
jgi:hypothetical protein